MLTGGCYCGWIRYETSGTPFNSTTCHCSICRRSTGGTFVSWFSVPKAEFKVLTGHPATFNSTEKATRSFCPQCGTQLTFEHEDFPDELDITTTSLDEPDKVPPQDHTYVSAKLEWVHVKDGLRAYPQARES